MCCWFCKDTTAELTRILDKKIEHDIYECPACTAKLERAFKNASKADWASARATANSWLQTSRGPAKKNGEVKWDEDSEEVSDQYAPR